MGVTLGGLELDRGETRCNQQRGKHRRDRGTRCSNAGEGNAGGENAGGENASGVGLLSLSVEWCVRVCACVCDVYDVMHVARSVLLLAILFCFVLFCLALVNRYIYEKCAGRWLPWRIRA